MTARKDVLKIARNLRRGIGFATSKRKMRMFGEAAIDIIVERTRRGRGVRRTNAGQRKLKGLSPNYIAYRRTQKLAPTTRPSKSNLTFTGQLLKSMTVKKVTNRKVTWGPNKRKRGGRGKFTKRTLTNEQVGEYVSNARPFNFLSKREISKIATLIDRVLSRELSKL